MKTPKIKLPPKLEPFKGVILFVVVLMLSNFLWKYNVLGDEDHTKDSKVMLWGMDISSPFVYMAHHVSSVCYSILHSLNSSVSLNRITNLFTYPNKNCVQIIWACTGLKQTYICFCIFLFSIGPWKKKIWYIPLALLVMYVFNIFRIAFIVACIENHPDWFNILHLYIFKYTFYGLIFLMWVYWEEKMNVKKPVQSSVNAKSESSGS
ncbi:MAG: exosortase/archaeosortase family protein [Paludibacter sp.]